jgi:hypothetical protein
MVLQLLCQLYACFPADLAAAEASAQPVPVGQARRLPGVAWLLAQCQVRAEMLPCRPLHSSGLVLVQRKGRGLAGAVPCSEWGPPLLWRCPALCGRCIHCVLWC